MIEESICTSIPFIGILAVAIIVLEFAKTCLVVRRMVKAFSNVGIYVPSSQRKSTIGLRQIKSIETPSVAVRRFSLQEPNSLEEYPVGKRHSLQEDQQGMSAWRAQKSAPKRNKSLKKTKGFSLGRAIAVNILKTSNVSVLFFSIWLVSYMMPIQTDINRKLFLYGAICRLEAYFFPVIWFIAENKASTFLLESIKLKH